MDWVAGFKVDRVVVPVVVKMSFRDVLVERVLLGHALLWLLVALYYTFRLNITYGPLIRSKIV